MHVVVFDYGKIEALPPVVSVTAALLDLNIHTTLIANHLWNLPESISHNPLFEGIELGQRTSSQQRLTQMISVPRQVRAYLNKNINSIDAVWTATDISARSAGKVLLKTKHIMQLSELVEYVPAFANRKMPFRSRLTIELAKKASCVVVPEYNRAHIQKAWWGLPEVPSVLPNKPYPNPPADFAEETASDMIAQEERKILLYQGVYAYDRDLEPYAAAIEKLGDSYALYLMGAGRAEATAKIRSLCDRYPRVHDVGFVPAPNHLAYTKYGHIGLLPYVLSKGKTRLSSLNPLFCAPNKIWEYSRYGLPMVGSDVPGLANVFSMNGIGETADTVEGIVAAVRAIEADYEGYSLRSSRYYNSIDFKSAVSEILERAGL